MCQTCIVEILSAHWVKKRPAKLSRNRFVLPYLVAFERTDHAAVVYHREANRLSRGKSKYGFRWFRIQLDNLAVESRDSPRHRPRVELGRLRHLRRAHNRFRVCIWFYLNVNWKPLRPGSVDNLLVRRRQTQARDSGVTVNTTGRSGRRFARDLWCQRSQRASPTSWVKTLLSPTFHVQKLLHERQRILVSHTHLCIHLWCEQWDRPTTASLS